MRRGRASTTPASCLALARCKTMLRPPSESARVVRPLPWNVEESRSCPTTPLCGARMCRKGRRSNRPRALAAAPIITTPRKVFLHGRPIVQSWPLGIRALVWRLGSVGGVWRQLCTSAGAKATTRFRRIGGKQICYKRICGRHVRSLEINPRAQCLDLFRMPGVGGSLFMQVALGFARAAHCRRPRARLQAIVDPSVLSQASPNDANPTR